MVNLFILVKDLQENLGKLQSRQNNVEIYDDKDDNDEELQSYFPCQNYAQFKELDEKLSADKMFRKKMVCIQI